MKLRQACVKPWVGTRLPSLVGFSFQPCCLQTAAPTLPSKPAHPAHPPPAPRCHGEKEEQKARLSTEAHSKPAQEGSLLAPGSEGSLAQGARRPSSPTPAPGAACPPSAAPALTSAALRRAGVAQMPWEGGPPPCSPVLCLRHPQKSPSLSLKLA